MFMSELHDYPKIIYDFKLFSSLLQKYDTLFSMFFLIRTIPELDEGKIYRETRDLMVETRFACRFSFKQVQRP